MAAYMRKAGILPVCTNNEGLAGEGDLLALVMLLNEHIKKANADCETSRGSMYLSRRIDLKRHPDQLLPLRQQPLLRAPGVHQFQR